MAIKSRSFDLGIGGYNEDLMRISENGRGRTFFSLITRTSVLVVVERMWMIQ